MPGPATIYAEQLTHQMQGYPLWDPNPQDEPAVEIADVGYVRNGAFIRLFNASREPGDECNRFGIPEQYCPLQVGEIQKRTPLPAKVPIQSESVLQLGVQASISGGAHVGGGFTFECSKEQGAVLILGDDADRRDALCRLPFLRYIRNYHDSWLTFANKVKQRGIVLSDLLLVTGCDKTSAWACAAFSGKSTRAGISFEAGQTSIGQAGVSICGTWKNWSSAATQVGPQRAASSAVPHMDYPLVSHIPDPSCQADFIDADGNAPMRMSQRETITLSPPPIRDQCVFLRGYKMCDKRTTIARLLARRKKTHYDGFEYASYQKGDDYDPDPDSSGSSGSPGSGGSGASGGSQAPPSTGSQRSNNLVNGTSGYESHGGPQDGSAPLGPDPTAFNASHMETIDNEMEDNVDLCDQLNQSQDMSPLDVLLDYILENAKEAELAVVHDDDLISLLESVESIDNFEVWIRNVRPQILLDENQVGMLETTYQLILSESAQPKNSVDVNPTLSTRVHALPNDTSSRYFSIHESDISQPRLNAFTERQGTFSTFSSDAPRSDSQHSHAPDHVPDTFAPTLSYGSHTGSFLSGLQIFFDDGVKKEGKVPPFSRSATGRTHRRASDATIPVRSVRTTVTGESSSEMPGLAGVQAVHIDSRTAPNSLTSLFSPVGKGGCWTCRLRRKKCDEQRKDGSCQTCLRLKIDCLGWGVRRPDWMRDKSQVEAYKAGIKRQLSSQGMIRGQPRTPVVPTRRSASPAQYQPPNTRHSLTLTGESDEGNEYSYDQGHSASVSPSYPMIQIPQLVPELSNTISGLDFHLYPTSGGPHIPPILASPYATSSSLAIGDDHHNMMLFSELSPSYYEPNAQSLALSSPSSNGNREHCIFYYFRRVRQIQFPFAGPDVTSVFHDLIVREPVGVVTNAMCALAALHKCQIRIAEGLENPNADNSLYALSKQFYDQAWWQMLDSRQRHGDYTEQDATAAIHLVSYWLFCGGGGEWQSPLDVASDWLAGGPLSSGANPRLQWLQLSASSRFTAQMTMWLDVISAVDTCKPPRFMDLYRRLFSVNQNYWTGSPQGGHVHNLHMDTWTGCPDAVMYAIAETANLAHWKAQQQQSHSLSVRELLRRSDAIEQDLRNMSNVSSPEVSPYLIDQQYDLNTGSPSGGSTLSSHPSPVNPGIGIFASTTTASTPEPTHSAATRSLVSSVFFEAALLYLQSVANDHNPVVPEIVAGVNATMQALNKLALSEADRGLVFPICLAGCLTDVPDQREFFKRRLQAQDTSFGNLPETQRLMEAVWRKRDNQGGVVDWRHTMPDIGTNLLVI